MTPQERDVLMPLLNRLRQTRAENKDAEADQLIRQTVQAQPDAPYVLAQTVLMQDYALHAAQDRIHALEQQLAQSQQQGQQHASGGGFLSGLLGGRSPAPSPAPAPPPPGYAQGGASYGSYAQPSYGAQIASAVQPGGGQSSFLRSAAQTAAGIAGGALLFQGLEGLFGGHGGFGGGLLGGGSGFVGGGNEFLGGAGGGSGLASVDNFVNDPGANAGTNYDDASFVGDQGGAQGGDVGGYADDTAYQTDSGQADYADTGSDTGGDVGGGDLGGGDFGGDDSFNS